mgnify:CR=1 FL=1
MYFIIGRKGNKYYLANYTAGMRVLDITNIAASTNSMSEIGFFDTHPENNNTGFDGAWSVYPYFDSENIIIGDIDRGLFVVRKSGSTLGLDTIDNNDSFVLSPNPAYNNAVISSQGTKTIESIKIYNILGKMLFELNNIGLQKFVLPIKNYEKGIYLIKINDSVSKKLLLK